MYFFTFYMLYKRRLNCIYVVKRLKFLLSFFHQKIMILITQLITGKVNCKLSNINKTSPKILIRECIEGITRQTISPRKITSTRKLYINFCQEFCTFLGQSPSKSKVKRFSFTAHSKSAENLISLKFFFKKV